MVHATSYRILFGEHSANVAKEDNRLAGVEKTHLPPFVFYFKRIYLFIYVEKIDLILRN